MIDDQLEFAQLHNGQVRRLAAFQDAADIDAGLMLRI
jgi:hypothetical protein